MEMLNTGVLMILGIGVFGGSLFHALLGLIRVDSRPDETRVRLLWFIHFDT